jgi:DNA polymerase III delta prime subunit
MVQTLGNAIKRDRLAHAFLMTGVRGVGKTSTARLIAKALNCIGEDGQGGPTIDPCGRCEPCVAIAEGRHIDVVEMDAASHTGVDDVREIIEAVRYAAVSARYKVYIIDEVHMLSKNAFNALLKTLEEPPAHVKFLFATTEVNKVPVTVLSRCQRFDLAAFPPSSLPPISPRSAASKASKRSPRRWRSLPAPPKGPLATGSPSSIRRSPTAPAESAPIRCARCSASRPGRGAPAARVAACRRCRGRARAGPGAI